MNMNPKTSIQGKSLIFNILFVLLNLTGLVLITVGSHDNFEKTGLTLQIIGYSLILITTIFLLVFKGRLMMSTVARVLVGGLFIVSGLVKANDPIGFAYKLEEYFEDGALAYRIKELFGMPDFSLEYFIQHALLLSVVICIVEIVLGVLLIIGGKIKLVAYLSVFMMLFFTFLTWHTANCDGTKKFNDRDTYAMSDPVATQKIEEAKTNKELRIISQTKTTLIVDEMKLPQCVSDCGCFGDAMKGSVGRSLSPKESLWKDLIVLYLCIWIFIAQWVIKPNTHRENLFMIISSLVVIGFFAWVFSWIFPVIFGLLALVLALWIRRAGGKVLGNYFGSTLIVTLLCAIFLFFVLRFEPMKDYRPYGTGSNLVEKMNDGVDGKYQSLLRYKNSKTGKEQFFDSSSKEYTDSKIWEKKEWKYVDMVQKAIIPTKIASITEQFNPFIQAADLSKAESDLEVVKSILAKNQIKIIKVKNLSSNDIYDVPADEFTLEEYAPENYKVMDTVYQLNESFSEISLRDYVVKTDQIVMITSRNLNDANWNRINDYKVIAAGCKKRNIPFIIVCNASRDQINAFRKKYNFNVPIFINDETELKAIARSNPSLMIIQKGIVAGKYPHRSTPSFDWLIKNVLK